MSGTKKKLALLSTVFLAAMYFIAVVSTLEVWATPEVRGRVLLGSTISLGAGSRIVLRGGAREIKTEINDSGAFHFEATKSRTSRVWHLFGGDTVNLCDLDVCLDGFDSSKIQLSIEGSELHANALPSVVFVKVETSSYGSLLLDSVKFTRQYLDGANVSEIEDTVRTFYQSESPPR